MDETKFHGISWTLLITYWQYINQFLAYFFELLDASRSNWEQKCFLLNIIYTVEFETI